MALAGKTEDFRCLYCDTLVIGAQSSDKMFHLLCIDRAAADLEAVKRKSIEPQDEYFVQIQPVHKKYLPDGANANSWTYDSYGWSSNHAVLYRNGEKVGQGWYGNSVPGLEARMEKEMALDKHKQKAKALNG